MSQNGAITVMGLLNPNPSALKVGQKVTAKIFAAHPPDLVRHITAISPDPECVSGYRASADAGVPCPHCGQHLGPPITDADAGYFLPVTTAGGAMKGDR
jgi:hypothetical protein